MPTHDFRIAWAVLGGIAAVWIVVALSLEFWALYDPEKGDTASEVIWSLNLPRLLWFVLAGVCAWALLHFLSGGKWGI